MEITNKQLIGLIKKCFDIGCNGFNTYEDKNNYFELVQKYASEKLGIIIKMNLHKKVKIEKESIKNEENAERIFGIIKNAFHID